jgi:hypothetical protein
VVLGLGSKISKIIHMVTYYKQFAL